MEINSVIVLCAVVFCAAVVFSSVVNRPRVIIQPERDDMGQGCVGGLIGLLMFAGLIIWLLISVDLSEATTPAPNPPPREEVPQTPAREQAEEAAPEYSPGQYSGLDKMVDEPIVNKPRGYSTQRRGATRIRVNEPPQQQSAQPRPAENTTPAYPTELSAVQSKPQPRWIIRVKRFDRVAEAKWLKAYFSKWNMRVIRQGDEYWNIVLVDSAADGQRRIAEWNKHADDFRSLDLELRIMPVYPR